MSEPQNCPKCGAELPADAPAGLCPKCLVAAGSESEQGSRPDQPTSDPEAPTIDSPSPGSEFLPPSPAQLADKFPQLEILELLGHGGMGAVYKARQTNLDRLVALKIIRPETTHDPAFAERFNREAKTLARLSHQSIVSVYDFGEVDYSEAANQLARPLYYFLMEYVAGANLRQLIRSGELTPEQALAIVPQICDALQYAHDEGVVHRDVKPENILLDKRGRVKIADFGLAKLATGSEAEFTLTGSHQVMGTLRYMAPEQLEGSHDVDHRADIYSLGVVFYEMLTGEAPMGHFEPPSRKVEVDVRLDEVVLRSLAREPDRRYQQASEVKSDVESIFSSDSGTASSAFHSQKLVDDVRKTAPAWLWWRNAAMFLAAWVFTASMWNFGKWGLYVSGAVFIAVITSAVRGRLRFARFLRDDAANDCETASGFAWACGVLAFILGYVLLINAQITSWDLCGFSERLEEIGQRLEASPHRLIRELDAFRGDIPTVELVKHGGIRHVSYSNVGELLWYWVLGTTVVLISVLTLAQTRKYRWTWQGHWKPSLSVTTALLGPLLLLTVFTHFTGGSLYGRHELRSSTDAEHIAAALAEWAEQHGYHIRSDGQWLFQTLPDGNTIGSLDLAQLEIASVFDRWKTSLVGVVEQGPAYEIQLVSSLDPTETIVRIDTSQAMIGPVTHWSDAHPAGDLQQSLLATLTAAVEREPGTPVPVE